MTEALDRYETLKLETPAPGLLFVSFDRPEVRNAISTKMGREMVDLFSNINADPSRHRCIVLTGVGDRAFCAGVDLKERKGMSDDTWNKQHALFERMMLAPLDCPLAHRHGGIFNMTRATLPHLIKSRGSIVDLSSAGGFGGDRGLINAVCPTTTFTDLTTPVFEQNPELLQRIPMAAQLTPKKSRASSHFLPAMMRR